MCGGGGGKCEEGGGGNQATRAIPFMLYLEIISCHIINKSGPPLPPFNHFPSFSLVLSSSPPNTPSPHALERVRTGRGNYDDKDRIWGEVDGWKNGKDKMGNLAG